MKTILKDIKNNLKPGITVFLVAIPLCLGIALASGAPILSGLISGIIGGIVVGFLSSSPLSVSGPAAGLVAVVLAAQNELGSFNSLLTAIILAGAIQFLFGQFGLGVIAHYIPNAVIKGMLAAIGVILILKQIPHALGYDDVFEGVLSFSQNDGKNTFTEFLGLSKRLTSGAIIISLVSFISLFFFSQSWIQKFKIFKFIPSSLIVILAGVLVNSLFKTFWPSLTLIQDHLVNVPDLFQNKSMVSILTFPDFTGLTNLLTYKQAFIIALIASIETLLCIEATDKLDPYKRVTPTGKELKAQGVGNMLSGLIGGLPITSVIVRSSVNVENQAQSKASTIIHGVLLFSALILGREFINQIPLASLACILIIVGYKLCSKKIMKEIINQGPPQFISFMATIVSILLTDLLIGVFIGLTVAMVALLYNYYKIQNFHLKNILGKTHKYQITFPEYVTFLSKANLEKTLSKIPQNSAIEFNLEQTEMIDYEVKQMLEDFEIYAKEKKITITYLKKEQEAQKLQFKHMN